jgi:catechol-2,3-dioxygenase
VDLFAGIPVRDYEEALAWYKRLLGSQPSFVPHATEAVWELAEHRFLFIVQRPEHAGHAMHLIFVRDLDAMGAEIGAGESSPLSGRSTRTVSEKPTYRDPDGNEVGLGGAPLTPAR